VARIDRRLGLPVVDMASGIAAHRPAERISLLGSATTSDALLGPLLNYLLEPGLLSLAERANMYSGDLLLGGPHQQGALD
jgi:hypothetical protein